MEFASQEDAQRSVRELSEQMLLSRPVFIREVCPRCLSQVLAFINCYFRTERMSHVSEPLLSLERSVWPWLAVDYMLHLLLDHLITTTLAKLAVTQAISCMSAMYVFPLHLHCNSGQRVLQLPYQAGWQDLKDLFRSAGNIIRADINIGADGRPKGSGTVIFETSKDAQQAVTMYHGFDWYGRTLEVREVSSSRHENPSLSFPL